ncbi:MAG: DUF4476 domain-containing protein [Flavobacteriales bacterium]|jgi:hypothetical protein
MKQIFTFLLITVSSLSSFAQNANAVVFSENGDKFTLVLNGEKQNAAPQTNVKLSNLTNDFYMARIDFEDASLPDFTEKNFAVHKGYEVTYVIKTNKKGEYVLRFQGESALSGSASSTPAKTDDIKIVDYAEEVEVQETPTKTTTTTSTTRPVVSGSTTTTTTTTTTKPATGEKVNVNMNVGGVNMGINMNIEGMEGEMEVEETTTTTVKSSSSNTTTTTSAPKTVAREEVVVVEKASGGCSRPMDSGSFTSAKGSISSKGFDDTKLSTAKQAVKANCMSVAQIKEVMGLFGFEESKLEFAKFAYDFCTDKNNYYMVGDAFSFSSSTDELNEFIESK